MTDLARRPEFSVSAIAHDGLTVVRPHGEIDAFTAAALETAIADALALHPYTLAVDFSGVTFMDSSACHALLRAQRQARKAAVGLELLGVTGTKLLILQILGLDKQFTITPGQPEPQGSAGRISI